MTARAALLGPLLSVPAFFGLRVASGLLLLKLSASFLPVQGFTAFSQLMLFAALLNMVAVGGAQNGLIRQVAAATDVDGVARAQGAAFALWLAALLALAVPLTVASGAISTLLVDTPRHAGTVIAIALLSLLAGPAQIWCGVLTGRKQITASMTAQALGLFASTALGGWYIVHGDAQAAAVGFAAGPLLAMAVSFVAVARLGIPFLAPRHLLTDIRALLGYSAAFVAVAGATSLTLFGLRSVYREAFGTVELGYWMVANRISDTSTQLLGLFMIQFFVPWFTAAATDAERRRIQLRSLTVATLVMGGFLAIFSLTPELLVRLLLSPDYVPAIGAIRTYMLGDTLRVWASLAMFTAFAAGRPGRYAAIELATVGMIAVITLVLIGRGDGRAPLIGYAGAYAIVAMVVSATFLLRKRTV